MVAKSLNGNDIRDKPYIHPVRGDLRQGVRANIPLCINITEKYATLTTKCRRPLAAAEKTKGGQWQATTRARAHYDMARNIRPIDVRLAYHLNRYDRPLNNRSRARSPK